MQKLSASTVHHCLKKKLHFKYKVQGSMMENAFTEENKDKRNAGYIVISKALLEGTNFYFCDEY